MHRSLRALAADLVIRASTLLDSLPTGLAGPAGQRCSDVRSRLQSLVAEAQAFNARDLDNPSEVSNNFAAYNGISQELRLLESYDAPFLLRWSSADETLTNFCWGFLDAIGWRCPRPLLGSFSSDYYWVHPRQAVIALPANEHARLLALGDICHELGHIVFEREQAQLVGDILREVQRWLRGQAAAAGTILGSDPADFLIDAFISWRAWLQEFVCDAIATYLAGPAYGWQHIRLACLDEAYERIHEPLLYGDHPADEARMRVILATLRVLGEDAQADELDSHWQGLSGQALNAHPAYDLVYATSLIEHLSRNVVTGLQALGLRHFQDAIDNRDLAVVANEAWRRLRSDPDGYSQWEGATVRSCLEGSAEQATP